jgi:hypothetical protein
MIVLLVPLLSRACVELVRRLGKRNVGKEEPKRCLRYGKSIARFGTVQFIPTVCAVRL